ncbi:hypothetical protein Q4F19_14875 [Sphingomonas sp. BIUV-7]|uniref:Uncharacterized protein n=1 Tax=Sphingomonas natans TaxID=3063330 RepID=A0ABT8YBG1_9SPHN|nr:hypothetical protein [Sphingomonas sp. BIUV-7]MDO6415672.1 hypothetical protein [Sphingomonas sp. BIUV-7]
MAKDDPARDARLAEALRVNLRRRKAQARAAEVPAAEAPSLYGEVPGTPAEAGAQED